MRKSEWVSIRVDMRCALSTYLYCLVPSLWFLMHTRLEERLGITLRNMKCKTSWLATWEQHDCMYHTVILTALIDRVLCKLRDHERTGHKVLRMHCQLMECAAWRICFYPEKWGQTQARNRSSFISWRNSSTINVEIKWEKMGQVMVCNITGYDA